MFKANFSGHKIWG